MDQALWPTWPRLYMVKTLENLLPKTQLTDDLELGMKYQVHKYYQNF